MIFQFYKNVFDKKGIVISIEQAITMLRTGKYKKRIQAYQKNPTPAEKINFPGFTFSGTFSTRKASELIEHSGLLVIDIDDKQSCRNFIAQKNDAIYLENIVLSFVSIGGEGLKIVYKIDANKHLESFFFLEKQLAQQGIIIDPSGKDVCRLCFVSWGLFDNGITKMNARPLYMPEKKVIPIYNYAK